MITLTKLRQVLQPRLFQRWLNTKGEYDLIGSVRNDVQCPVAVYLREMLDIPYDDPAEQRIEVSVTEQSVALQTFDEKIITSTVIPLYFTKLIERVDSHSPYATYSTTVYISAGKLREITHTLSS